MAATKAEPESNLIFTYVSMLVLGKLEHSFSKDKSHESLLSRIFRNLDELEREGIRRSARMTACSSGLKTNITEAALSVV